MAKKYQKLALVLVLILALCLVVACYQDPEPEPPAPIEPLEISMNLANVTLDLFESVDLSIVGADATPSWSSSNPEVATVSAQGHVSAVSAGKTTVTATVGEATATCEVKVEDSGERPVLSLNRLEPIGVFINQTFSLSAEIKYKGKVVGNDVTFAIDNSQIATVSEAGLVTGLSSGNAVITVSGQYNGYDVTPVTINVTVTRDIAVSLDKNQIELYASSPNGEVTTATLIATVKEAGAVVSGAEVVWATEDSSVATVENGVVTAVGAGTTKLTASYNDGTFNYATTIQITVVRPVVALAGNFDMNMAEVGDYATLKIDVDCSAVQTVSIDGVSLDFVAQADGVKVSKASLEGITGATSFVLQSSTVEYSVNATVATVLIRDAYDLAYMEAMAAESSSDNYLTGYFVLDADIDYSSQAFGIQYFGGIFEGRGHIIKNINVKDDVSGGLFVNVNANGVIRNVAFVNVVNNTAVGSAGFNRRNLLAFVFKGTLENVYLEGTRASAIVGAISGAIGQPGNSDKAHPATIKNLVAILDDTAATNNSAGGYGSAIGQANGYVVCENVIGISSRYPWYANDGYWAGVDGAVKSTKCAGYTSISEATFTASDWDESIWDLSGKIPVFKGYVLVEDLTAQGAKATLEFANDGAQALASQLSSNGLTGEIAEIRALDGTVLSTDGTITLTADLRTKLLGTAKSGDATIVVKVTDGSKSYTYKLKITFVTKYIATAADLAAMEAMGADSSSSNYLTGLYVLTADIDYANAGFCINYFGGTFEGQGHTISNIKVKDAMGGGLFVNVNANGVIRNVAFVNLVNDLPMTGDWIRRNLLAFVFQGTIENVYVSGSRKNIEGNYCGVIGQPGNSDKNHPATIKNLVVILDDSAATNVNGKTGIGSALGGANGYVVCENVIGISSRYPWYANDGYWAGVDGAVKTTNCVGYTSVSEASGATYSATDWNATIWDISGDIPVFVEK